MLVNYNVKTQMMASNKYKLLYLDKRVQPIYTLSMQTSPLALPRAC